MYRDIYPSSFYELLHVFGIGKEGQKILDIGTGVLPINMYKYGGEYTGIDISEEQIKYAKLLAEKKGLNIQWKACSAEDNNLPDNTFDFITAVQCWIYFDKKKIIPEIKRLLKKDGELVIAFMNWLPKEDFITDKSLGHVKKCTPSWQAFNDRNPIVVPKWCEGNFRMSTFYSYDVYIPFTYESWNGRIKASSVLVQVSLKKKSSSLAMSICSC